MHKRIIMLAKIALIIAAAQLQITTTKFISTQTNTNSIATYAISKAEEQINFEFFKNEIERTVRQTANQPLSEADHGRIKQKIQDFIGNDERIALVLYIANQWDIIKELGWKSDAVSNYVQNCLRDLYNSMQEGPTIHIASHHHKGIAAAIENIKKQPIDNDIQRALLRDILQPGLNKTNIQTVLDKAEGHELTNEIKKLTPDEENLICLINNCADVFPSARGQTNAKTQQITGLIEQLTYQNVFPLHASELRWLQDKNKTINKIIAESGLALYKLLDKTTQNDEAEEGYKSLERTRPDIILTIFLLNIHGINKAPHIYLKDPEMIELAKQIQQNIKQAFLSSDENGANQTRETPSNNTQTQEGNLLNEFLKFIIGWEIPTQISRDNRFTIFKEAAEKIKQASHETTSIKLTQKQQDLLTPIKIAYSTLKRLLEETARKQCQTDELNYQTLYIEMYEQILDKVLREGKIEASQIEKELNKHKNSLKAIEEANKENLFSYKVVEFLKKQQLTYNYITYNYIPRETYIPFLRSHIKDNIYKYLAVMIQSNHSQIPVCKRENGYTFSASIDVHSTLYTLPNYVPQQEQIIINENKKQQISHILNTISEAHTTKPSEQTTEQKILSLLFTYANNDLGRPSILTQMQELIKYYRKEERITTTKDQLFLISFLDTVAELLKQEHLYQQSNNLPNDLGQIAQIVKDFSEICKNKQNERQKQQQTQINNNANELQQQINQYDTYYQSMQQYIASKGIKEPLDDRQYDEFLQLYIGQDITRYLALLIQSNHVLIPYHYNQQNERLTSPGIYSSLFDYKILKNGPTPKTHDTPTTTNHYNKKQFLNIKSTIHNIINNAGNTRTITEKILSLLFTYKAHDHKLEDNLFELTRLTRAYKNDEIKTVDNEYSELISYLGTVAQQLLKENSLQHSGKRNTHLKQLAQIVSKFSEVYNKQQNNQPGNKKSIDTAIDEIYQLIHEWNQQKETILKEKEDKLNKLDLYIDFLEQEYNTIGAKQPKTQYDTYSYNIIEYLKDNQITKPLTKQQHIDFLRKYIGNDITKHLALIIQANYNLIPTYYRYKNGPNLITAFLLDQALVTCPLVDLHYGHNATNTPISEFSYYLFQLKLFTKPEKRTNEDKILLSLFTERLQETTIEQALTKLRATINAYRKDDTTTVDEKNSIRPIILRYLGLVADQLFLENLYINKGDENAPLAQLAQLVRDFSNAYKNKLKNKNRNHNNNHNNQPHNQETKKIATATSTKSSNLSKNGTKKRKKHSKRKKLS